MNEEEKNIIQESGEENPAVEENAEVTAETAADAIAGSNAEEGSNVVPEPEQQKKSENLPQPEFPPQKKAGKKPLIIAAAVVVIAVIAAVIAVTASSSPISLVEKGVANSLEAAGKSDLVTLLNSTLKNGSVAIDCDLETIVQYPLDGSVSVKQYFSKGETSVIAAGLEVDGDTILDASLFANNDKVIINSDTLFHDGAYGINLEKFAEKFNKSVFGPDGDLSLGIEMNDTVDSFVAESAKFGEDGAKIATDFLDTMVKKLKKHADISKKSETLELNGNDVKTTAVTITVDGAAAAALIEDAFKYVRDNAEMKEFLYDYADFYSELMQLTGAGYYDEARDAIDELYEALEDITDEDFEELAEELEDIDISVKFYITKSGKELIGIKLDGKMYGDNIKLSVIAGPSWNNIEEISIRADDGYSVYRISYNVDTNDKKEYSAKLKIREGSDTVFSGKIEWDKKDGDFEFEGTDSWGDTYGVEGALELSSKNMVLELDSIYSYYDEQDVNLSLTVSASDKMPSMPKYTDVLGMDAEEIEDAIYDIRDALYDVSDILETLYYTMYYYY